VPGSADETGAATCRPLLFSIAYAMTGSVGDAEDIVQDAYLGLTRARQAGTRIADPKAYLATAVTRLGINYLFGYGYPDVARITSKTEVNCRQIFARARQRITAGGQARDRAPLPARRAEGEELARRFFEAAAGGDMDALLGMLAPDVVFHADGGGKAQTIAAPLHGRERVARLLLGLFRRGRSFGASLRLAWVNGQPGAIGYDAQGRVFTVFELEVADGVVQTIRAVVNPDKLGHLGPVSDVARLPEKELPQHRHNADEGGNR
jgi:Sigma-70 region 2/SnoaL-like domain